MPTGAYSTATNRQSFVSFADKDMGEVRLGYQYTALYTVSTNSGYHLGSEQPGGDFAHGTLSNGDYGGTRANGITYITPKFFANTTTFTLQKGAGTGRESADFSSANAADSKTQNDGKRWSLLANYVSGGLNASYAHTNYTTAVSAVSAGTTCVLNVLGACTNVATTAAAAVNSDAKLDQFAGSYQLGAAKLTYSLANGKRTEAVGATVTKTKAQQFGAEYAFGKIRPYIIAGTGTVTNDISGAKTFDGKSSQFGVRYDLSKRTIAYIMSGKAEDNSVASTASTIAKREGTAIGLFHTF
jgi:predicted porin